MKNEDRYGSEYQNDRQEDSMSIGQCAMGNVDTSVANSKSSTMLLHFTAEVIREETIGQIPFLLES